MRQNHCWFFAVIEDAVLIFLETLLELRHLAL
jgi:hypothetical protein